MATLHPTPVTRARRSSSTKSRLTVEAALQLAVKSASKRLKADGLKLPTQTWDSPRIKNPVR